MRLSDLKAGDKVFTDGGFTCMRPMQHVVQSDDCGLFISCAEGKHYLDGQESETGELVGITRESFNG